MLSLKWSLRSMLLLLTLAGVFLAWKYNQRNQIISATKHIQSLGGSVVYRWENPTIAMQTMTVSVEHPAKIETKTRTLADGSVENYDKFLFSSKLATANVELKTLKATGNANEEYGILNFLGNDDIFVDAVRIHEADVDADLIQHLKKLDGLRIVQVCRDIEYFQLSVIDPRYYPATGKQKADRFKELIRRFEAAKTLINKGLPKIDVVDGSVFQMPENGG